VRFVKRRWPAARTLERRTPEGILAPVELLYTAHVPAGDGPFPTVVALHGLGASAHDLIGLAPLLHDGQALVVCPEGPLSIPIGPGPGATGRAWFPLTRGGPTRADALERAATQVVGFLDALRARYPIRPDRLVLLGFSQGGVLAYRIFLERPERFAGLVALSSWLPQELDERLPVSESPIDRPALVIHGTRDPMIEVERGRESRKRLLRRHVPLTYREYDMGHEINPDALRELRRWLDDKVFTPVQLL